MFSAIGHAITRWYVAAPLLAVVGIIIGYQFFFNVYPGKPKIGVIDIPYTVISDDSAYFITAFLEFARRDPSIKGVVIRLNSPGGGATASEQLYLETRKLREEKPVVIVMNSLVASGGFMMAMGATHTYAKSSSLVGNVGVISSASPVLPAPPDENLIFTGPFKLTGSSRRGWIAMMDQLKQAFAEMVIVERGDKLKIAREDLVQGQLFAGMEAVRLGLVDEIGNDADAFRKVQELAGISSYDVVDVNVEVERFFVQQSRRIFASSDDPDTPLTESDLRLMSLFANASSGRLPETLGQSPEELRASAPAGPIDLESVRRPMEFGVMGATQEDPFPEFPLEINKPNIYYMYVGNAK